MNRNKSAPNSPKELKQDEERYTNRELDESEPEIHDNNFMSDEEAGVAIVDMN